MKKTKQGPNIDIMQRYSAIMYIRLKKMGFKFYSVSFDAFDIKFQGKMSENKSAILNSGFEFNITETKYNEYFAEERLTITLT